LERVKEEKDKIKNCKGCEKWFWGLTGGTADWKGRLTK
jgi:hypothetical protein